MDNLTQRAQSATEKDRKSEITKFRKLPDRTSEVDLIAPNFANLQSNFLVEGVITDVLPSRQPNSEAFCITACALESGLIQREEASHWPIPGLRPSCPPILLRHFLLASSEQTIEQNLC